MNKRFKIGNRFVGENEPCYIIAEMSANHGGDFEKAIEIVHKAKEAGADCLKIQTYTADTITIDSDKEYFQIKNGNWKGENLYKLYQRAFTPWQWQADIKKECDKVGIDFLSTPFDSTSVDFLEDLNVDFYKIASFELVDIPLIKYVASKKKPIIMSTGMGSEDEIQDAICAMKSVGNEDLILLKCSSAYPAISDNMNLNTMVDMKKFGVSTGLSDHSLGFVGAITAVAMGAKVVEKHFCLGRDFETADSNFSMNGSEFKEMVDAIRDAEKAMGRVNYGYNETDEKTSYSHRKSIFVVRDIKRGEIFSKDNIRVIRPGHGLKPKYYEDILGKKASVDIEYATPLSLDMVGD